MLKPVKIVPDRLFKGLYRLAWADGTLSADFYNLTRANDNLRYYADKVADMNSRKLQALKRAGL